MGRSVWTREGSASSTRWQEATSGFHNQETVKGRKEVEVRYIEAATRSETLTPVASHLNNKLDLVDHPFPDKLWG